MTRDLGRLQQGMAELIRTGGTASDDAYFAAVQSSTGLDVLRGCIAEWRELVLRRVCPLTVGLLESRGAFADAVRRLLRRDCPPFLHELALAFLEDVAADADPELRAAADYEAGMIRTYSG